MAERGKNKINDLMEDLTYENEDGKILHKILYKAQQAKEELEKKMEEIAVNIYGKMHIAHTDEIKILSKQIENLTKSIEATESRIKFLENKITA
jgi:predicted RNase H-like nuclease (RuvC/YqgF family)